MHNLKFLFFFISTISIAQSSFEILLPSTESLSLIGRKSIVTNDGFIYVAAPMHSAYPIGGMTFFDAAYSGTKIWKLSNNGELLDSSGYDTAGDFGWSTSYNLFNSQGEGQIALLYNYSSIEFFCGSQDVEENYTVGAYIIDEQTFSSENYSVNTPCEYERVKFSHIDNAGYSRIYVDESDSLFFEKRTSDFDLINKQFVPINTSLSYKYSKSEVGFVMVGYDADQINLVHIDDDGTVLNDYDFANPYEMDSYSGLFNYAVVGGNRVISYAATYNGIKHSYLITVNEGEIMSTIELDEGLSVEDICVYGDNLLVLANKTNTDCSNSLNSIKLIMLDSELTIQSVSSFGQEYTRGYNLELTEDEHFIITGGKYVPSECLSDGEEFYPHPYLIKSSLKELKTTDLISDYNYSISPNPTNRFVNISLDKKFQEVCVRNITGEIVKQFTVDTNKLNIDLSDCKSGVYIISAKVGNQWLDAKVVLE